MRETALEFRYYPIGFRWISDLEGGRAEIDSNNVEWRIRLIALDGKNALFGGSDGGARHWAIAALLVNTAQAVA